MPLTIKGGPYSSSKCINNKSKEFPTYKPTKSSTEDKAKVTSSRVNASNEINNHTTQKGIIKDLEINSYKDVMLREPGKKKDLAPMEEWSILSDHVKYVMHGKSEAFQKLSIDSMNYRQNRDLYKSLNNEQTIRTNLNFGKSPEKLKADYLDMYKGVLWRL